MLESTYKYVKLEDVVVNEKNAIVDGPFGSSLKVSDYVEDGIPVLQGKNITNNRFNLEEIRCITEKKAHELRRSKVYVGDILIVKIGSIGYAAELSSLGDFPYAIIPANLAKATICETKVNKDFLLHWLNSEYTTSYLKRNASKTAQPALSLSKIKEIPILLPPLGTQKKIAEVLDKAQELIDKRKEQIEKIDEFIQSVFLDMFGDPITNSKQWNVVALDEICKKITDGTHQSPKFIDRGIPFILVSNIIDGEITYDTNKFISEEDYNELIKRTPIEIGDILYTIVGSYGNPAVVKSLRKFCFQRHIAYLKPDLSVVNPYYLKESMLTQHFKVQLEKRVRGVAQKTLNLSELKAMNILLPPLHLQNKFAQIVEKTEQQKELLQQSLTEMENNFNSLIQRAFKGELF